MMWMEENPIMYDGRPPREPRRWTLVYALIAVAVALFVWVAYQRRAAPPPAPPPVRVVSDRPGGNVPQAEAIRAVRRHLVERGTKNECIAIKADGPFQFTAVDSCRNTRLGRFKVDPKTGTVH